MIQVKPQLENEFLCPKCSHLSVVKEIVVQPIVTLADCVCENCGFAFFQTLPIGHTVSDTLIISQSKRELYPIDTKQTWLTEALLKAYRDERRREVHIRKIVYREFNQVVILNTLDFLYGHVLLKLFNATHHLEHDKNTGLILIIPKLFEWLVPSGCAEVWIVDLKLNELSYFHQYIQEFASKEFARFQTIYLSKAYSHPDFTTLDISQFTGIKPFELNKFALRQPVFTFVLREDRWWLSGPLDYWFYRICRKLRILKMGSRVLSLRQNRLIRKTISLMKKKLPHANFYIVGLGATGNYKGYAQDERKNSINDSVEQDWCKIYAQSHVVIGVHGSNMLLPTAHAAGCVEILPEDRYGNIVQDIAVRYTDRKQLLFYRFADQYASPKAVATKVVSIVENFETFEKSMCSNVYSSVHGARLRDDIYAIS